MSALDEFEARIDAVNPAPDGFAAARDYLALGEEVLELWISARGGGVPTSGQREGFRLLALHRQGAKGDPSFNACRETCRELCFRYNVAMSGETPEARVTAASAMAHLARHLYFFVSGKMQTDGLGDFCCSSKPLRLDKRDLQ